MELWTIDTIIISGKQHGHPFFCVSAKTYYFFIFIGSTCDFGSSWIEAFSNCVLRIVLVNRFLMIGKMTQQGDYQRFTQSTFESLKDGVDYTGFRCKRSCSWVETLVYMVSTNI